MTNTLLGIVAGPTLRRASLSLGESCLRLPLVFYSNLLVPGLAHSLHLSMPLSAMSPGFFTRRLHCSVLENSGSRGRDTAMRVSGWIRLHPARPAVERAGQALEAVAASVSSHARHCDLYVVAAGDRLMGVVPHCRIAEILLTEHLSGQTSHQIMERVSRGSVKDLMDRDCASARADEELDDVLNPILQ